MQFFQMNWVGVGGLLSADLLEINCFFGCIGMNVGLGEVIDLAH